jgi:thioredoxin reductase
LQVGDDRAHCHGMSNDTADVLVIGGGPAGLSAAVALSRFRRRVVVVDAGSPRNAPADGVHNLITRDGLPPLELQRLGRAEVERYGGVVRAGTATGARRTATGLEVTLEDGDTLTARRLLVATGLRDELPDVQGLRERWGRDVVNCPYCHGWEVRDTAIGVLGTSPVSLHLALLFRQLSDRVVYLPHTGPPLESEQREQLDALGIPVVEGAVERVAVQDDRLAAVVLVDGRSVPVDTLAVAPRAVAHSPALAALGLTTQSHPMGSQVGETYACEPGGATAVPGVWVAGNVADVQAQVVSSAAAGLAAGAALNADLVAEDVQRAVAAAREPAGV